MEFVTNIPVDEYENFVSQHPLKSHFMQSYYFGELKSKFAGQVHHVGLKEAGKLVATALLLEMKLPLTYTYLYSPRGYVIDFNDVGLLTAFTAELKRFAKTRKAIFIRINPDIKLHQIDEAANKIAAGSDNYAIVETLLNLAYTRKPLYRNFELAEPRFTFRLDLTQPLEEIKAKMHQTLRNIINRENIFDVEIAKTTADEIVDFYRLMQDTEQRDGFTAFSLAYYQEFYQTLHDQQMSDLYLAKVKKSKIKETFNLEITKNKALQAELSATGKNKGRIKDLNDQLNKLLKQQAEFNKRAEKLPETICLSGMITTKYHDKTWNVHGGNNDVLRDLNANYLMYYKIIEDYKAEGYKILDLFGTTGNPVKENSLYGLHQFKRRFGAEYIEFIGEFDLVLNPPLYFIYDRCLPFYRKVLKLIRKIKK